MWHTKESQRYMKAFIGTFLFFVIFRIALNYFETRPYHPCYLYMIPQISSFLIVSLWLLTVESRIIHKTIKRQMFGIGIFYLLNFLMQMVKYCLFIENVAVCRYMWYGYYVPMTMIPLLTFYILHNLSSTMEDTSKTNKKLKLFAIPAVLICLGFLTNDLHQLAFGIVNWHTASDQGRTLGPIYYLYIAYTAILLLLGVRNIFRLYKNQKNTKHLRYTLIPLVLGILYILIYTVKNDWVKANGKVILQIPEIFAFMIIGFLEVCIQLGLIPSNIGYGKLFSLSEIPAQVLDIEGNTAFATQSEQKCFEETSNHRIDCIPVKGGSFLYNVDLSNLNRLNRELDAITTNLEARNDLLRHENEIVMERKGPEEAIRIYDSISELVRPQILEVKELLSSTDIEEEQLRARLVRSAVLNAYIKRRSNMELEAQKTGKLLLRELMTAAAESLEYFKLSGAETFLSFPDEENCLDEEICSAQEIIHAYVAFEIVLENILGSADYLMVRFTLQDTIGIRFQMSGRECLRELDEMKIEDCTVECISEDNDIELIVSLLKGGDER